MKNAPLFRIVTDEQICKALKLSTTIIKKTKQKKVYDKGGLYFENIKNGTCNITDVIAEINKDTNKGKKIYKKIVNYINESWR